MLQNYLGMLWPVIPLYVEEAWSVVPTFMKKSDSCYQMGWFRPDEMWEAEDLARDMQSVEPFKESVLKILEQARQNQCN
jgi:isoleucyl-tRNA synthetase